jgi:EmrB/QacA subfamily drug resistance transporter
MNFTRKRSSKSPPADSNESERSLIPLFIGLMVAMFLSALSATVLSVALPTMVGELNGVDQMLWVMTAYILASTIVMPIVGKVGDLIGRKGLLIAAILIFIAGSVIGGLSTGMGMMVIGRVVQGLGGGGLMILSQATIADVIPARERGKYMGAMGAVFAASSVAGPLLGGWLTEGPGWRWTFWINIPLGIIAALAAIYFLHIPKVTHSKPKFDVWGMTFIAVATTCLVLVASWAGNHYAWDSPTILALIAGTVVAGITFVLVEWKTAEPLIPMMLFKDRNFNLATSAGLLIGVPMFGSIGYLPTYLQMSFGADATTAGLLMIPTMAAVMVTNLITGVLASKYGRYKWMPITGSLLLALSLVLLGTLTLATPLWVLCSYLAIMGMGVGTSVQILVLIVQNSFHISLLGTATASNNYFRQIGASLGSAIVGSLFASRLMGLLSDQLPEGSDAAGGITSLTPVRVHVLPHALRDPILLGYNDALVPLFLYMVPLALLSFVLLCFLKEVPLATTIDRDIRPESLTEGELLLAADKEPANENVDREPPSTPRN